MPKLSPSHRATSLITRACSRTAPATAIDTLSPCAQPCSAFTRLEVVDIDEHKADRHLKEPLELSIEGLAQLA